MERPRRGGPSLAALEGPNRRGRRFVSRQDVSQRQSEGRRLDLEQVSSPGLDTVRERQGRRAEEMHVHVAGTAEEIVEEVRSAEASANTAVRMRSSVVSSGRLRTRTLL